LDTWSKNTRGGTGQTFDWQIARKIAADIPVFVAGGLTPENVKYLIREVHPLGVDVSSGVETCGKKDNKKIRDFIREVKGEDNCNYSANLH
jgi:phosphoribosylanthranilate isomerase